MTREHELEMVRRHVRMQAEHVARLLDIVARTVRAGRDPGPAEDKLELFETLLWKHHSRYLKLKAGHDLIVPPPPAALELAS